MRPALLPPPVAVAGDGRACLGVPIGFDPNLPGNPVHVQAAVISGATVRLTNDTSIILR